MFTALTNYTLFATFWVVLCHSNAYAQDGQPSPLTQSKTTKNDTSENRFSALGVSDLSWLQSSPAGNLYPKLELDQTGYAPAIKVLGTLSSQRFVFDFGLGIQTAFYSGERIGRISILKDENGEDYSLPEPISEKYSIRQNSMVIEVGARIKLRQNLQIGFVGNALYSKNNSLFSSPGEDLEKISSLIFVGPQIVYEASSADYIKRIGTHFSVSLSGRNRAIYLTTISAGIGREFISINSSLPKNNVDEIHSKIAQAPAQAINNKELDSKDSIFDFQIGVVALEPNSNELSQESANLILEIARTILEEKDAWKTVSVEFRTDSNIFSDDLNDIIALNKKAIVNEFKKLGVEAEALVISELKKKRDDVTEKIQNTKDNQPFKIFIRLRSSKDKSALKNSIQRIIDKNNLASPQTRPSDEESEKNKSEISKKSKTETKNKKRRNAGKKKS